MKRTTLLKEQQIQGARVMVAHTGAKDVVSIEGSVLGGPNHFSIEKLEAGSLLAELLDAGTSTRTKADVREALSDRGATVTFRGAGDRTWFSASCFPEDLSFVITLIMECLAQAEFPAAEIKAARARLSGELAERRTDTSAQAADALTRILYARGHVNFIPSSTELQKSLDAATRADVLSMRRRFGTAGMIIAVAGDVKPKTVFDTAAKALRLLPEQGVHPTSKQKQSERKTAEAFIHIPDKANIDVFFGRTLDITVHDDTYLPHVIAASLLGGRGLSTGHLMRTIRERDGLTYGIYAGLQGLEDGSDGYFRIWATFSPSTFAQAVQQVRKEINVFLKSGLTEEALADKKVELVGRYLFSLSTTRGMAAMLHAIAREERPLSYLIDFPEDLRSVSLADVRAAAVWYDPAHLSLAAAGTKVKGL